MWREVRENNLFRTVQLVGIDTGPGANDHTAAPSPFSSSTSPVFPVMYEMVRWTTAPQLLTEVKNNFSATSMKAMEEKHQLPGKNKPGGDKAKGRTAGTKK